MTAFAFKNHTFQQASTEEIMTQAAAELVTQAEKTLLMRQYGDSELGQRRFFSGDNSVVVATISLDTLQLQCSDRQLFDGRSNPDDALHLRVGYRRVGDALAPIGLTAAGVSITMQGRDYTPKLLPSGDYSFEPAATPGGSLDQESIIRCAAFAMEVAETPLIPVRYRR